MPCYAVGAAGGCASAGTAGGAFSLSEIGAGLSERASGRGLSITWAGMKVIVMEWGSRESTSMACVMGTFCRFSKAKLMAKIKKIIRQAIMIVFAMACHSGYFTIVAVTVSPVFDTVAAADAEDIH